MSAVFHLFDFHHFQCPLNSHHQTSASFRPKHDDFLLNEISLPKGVEAPRNSLEEPSLSPTRKDESLNISMGIQIKTKTTRDRRSKLEALSNCDSYSPSPKTPSLVARLMGLDLLPDHSLSSSSSSPSINLGTPNIRTKSHNRPKQISLHRNSVDGGTTTGTRSLPETPRISLSRKSDVDHYQHRLSLQLNRENICEQELMFSRVTSSRKKELKQADKENLSPKEYARQIVKQVKETVNRRAGTDITNTIKNKDSSTTLSCSPRLRFLENSEPKPLQAAVDQTEAVKVSVNPRLQMLGFEPPKEQEKERKPVNKCKKAENEMKFGSRLVKPPQTMQERPFVRSAAASRSLLNSSHGEKKCKKTPLSNDLLNSTTVPSLLPFKKDPSPPATKLPHKQSNSYMDALKVTETQARRASSPQLSNSSSQIQKHIAQENYNTSTTTAATTTGRATVSTDEHDYIAGILRRIGVDKNTPISYAKWFSPSHPLDPSIFYIFEHFAKNKSLSGNLSLRCNRKLLFHLVDEILVDVLKPYMNTKPWVCNYPIKARRDCEGSELMNELCLKIRRFPCADCRVLEDIDGLVGPDLPAAKVLKDMSFEEEGEGMVSEIEKEILESLLIETASEYTGSLGSKNASF